MKIIPDNYRYLSDSEIITNECMCFGKLSNGDIGWGLPPKRIIGQNYCEGASCHPKLIAVEKSDRVIK